MRKRRWSFHAGHKTEPHAEGNGKEGMQDPSAFSRKSCKAIPDTQLEKIQWTTLNPCRPGQYQPQPLKENSTTPPVCPKLVLLLERQPAGFGQRAAGSACNIVPSVSFGLHCLRIHGCAVVVHDFSSISSTTAMRELR